MDSRMEDQRVIIQAPDGSTVFSSMARPVYDITVDGRGLESGKAWFYGNEYIVNRPSDDVKWYGQVDD